MGQTAKVTRENRTITVDFHNEATYAALLGALSQITENRKVQSRKPLIF